MTSQKPSVLLISMTVFLSSNLLADSSLKTHYIVNASGGLTGYASEYVIETGLKGPMIQTKTVDVTEKSVVDEIIDMEQETVLRSVNNSAGVSQTFEDRSDEIYGLSKSVFETTDDPLPVDLGSCKWSADRISAKDLTSPNASVGSSHTATKSVAFKPAETETRVKPVLLLGRWRPG